MLQLQVRRKMNQTHRIIIAFTATLLLVLLSVLAGRTYCALYNINLVEVPRNDTLIVIKPGLSLGEVAIIMQEAALLDHPSEFIFAAEFLGLDQQVQAGEYELSYGLSNHTLLKKLTSAGTSATLITVPEGFTLKQIAGLLKNEIGIDSVEFLKAAYDTSLIKQYGIKAPSFEGFLFPDSYDFHRFMSPQSVIEQMAKRFFQIWDEVITPATGAQENSIEAIVTLASIIEGEMIQKSEAPNISCVYNNRLKRNMKLQADPTIQYIIRNGPRRLYNGDLEIQSSYNTYLHAGLPPGPVCNPGREALIAALTPADEPFLYMVSRGDGSHAFNENFSDHLKAKAGLDSIRREISKNRWK